MKRKRKDPNTVAAPSAALSAASWVARMDRRWYLFGKRNVGADGIFYIEKEAKIGRELVGVLVLAIACMHASSIPSFSFPFRWGPSCISLSLFYIRSSESMINRYQPSLAIHVTLVVNLCSHWHD